MTDEKDIAALASYLDGEFVRNEDTLRSLIADSRALRELVERGLIP